MIDINKLIDDVAERVSARLKDHLKQKTFEVLHILSIPEASVYLGCTVNQLRSMVRTGMIPAVRHLDHMFVAVEDLDCWLAAHSKTANPKKPSRAA